MLGLNYFCYSKHFTCNLVTLYLLGHPYKKLFAVMLSPYPDSLGWVGWYFFIFFFGGGGGWVNMHVLFFFGGGGGYELVKKHMWMVAPIKVSFVYLPFEYYIHY